MKDKMYRLMLLRRRYCKRGICAILVIVASFYVYILLFGNLNSPQINHLTDLYRCPACYGVSICPELYSNQISLQTDGHWSLVFNAKNIYYGSTKSNRKVILKKLAHDWELKEFDSNLCKKWNMEENCKPMQLVNATNIDDKIINIVEYNFTWPDAEPRKGLVLCPYAYSILDLIKPLIDNRKLNNKSEMLNIWTMLSINPEPIILQILPKAHSWPVSAYAGVCGRLEVVAYEGEPISSLTHIEWRRKLKIAKKILDAAMDFTFKHDRFRFYLMDWSLDNIVANEKDEISFVDLEDVIILDKHISPKKDLPDWYQRYNRELIGPGFTFSIENMCKHHLSDHNLWAACYIIGGEDNPLLYPIPKSINTSRPYLDKLLIECLNSDDRFKTLAKIQHYISDMLMDDKLFGSATVR
ncbi:PREDICTED: deleted in autism protein 1 homolog [Papilio xuthus]|uniref:Deleted in autism protein 1 homolog n=1 Tax=Papilio xuthus TaxID=66420 RepID=A0AAJ7EJB8_PAPXU|nr:PREDICTED: deleted in autism protein 1 homolog [Papilio xuthus]